MDYAHIAEHFHWTPTEIKKLTVRERTFWRDHVAARMGLTERITDGS